MSIINNFSNPDFLRFVEDNANADVSTLRLKYYGKDLGFDVELAITQAECIRKASKKLSGFIADGCRFPDKLAGEQASNEAVAKYHSGLVLPSTPLFDLTAGLGIDFMEMSKSTDCECTAVEYIRQKADTLRWNCEHRKLMNCNVICGDSLGMISEIPENATVFIDPARRADDNKRIFDITRCMPDITLIASDIIRLAGRLIVKCSPMLDITQTIRQFPIPLCEVHVVDMQGECKEVLLVVDKNMLKSKEVKNIRFVAVELWEGYVPKIFEYVMPVYDENNEPIRVERSDIPYCGFPDDIEAGMWLYHPSAALMKLSPWQKLVEMFNGLRKIDLSTHLFVSDNYIEDFPGRVLKIEKKLSGKEMKRIKGRRLNVVARNYPITAEQIVKKYGIKGGDNEFLYAFRQSSHPLLLLCRRITGRTIY